MRAQRSTRGGVVNLVRNSFGIVPAAALALCGLLVATTVTADDEPAHPVSVGGASSVSVVAVGQPDFTTVFSSSSTSGVEKPTTAAEPVVAAAEPAYDTATALSGLAQQAPESPTTLPEAEEIRERYPNGAVRLVRNVVQDERGNYLNHGPWTLYEDNGNVIAEGQFERGAMHGAWQRIFQAGQGEMFRGPLYKQFSPPFTAQATFDHGLLHGAWTVRDADRRLASDWHFERGQRHGLCQWWFIDGQPWREAAYHNGRLDGAVRQWSTDGDLELEEQHLGGRRRELRVEWHGPEKKKSEVEILLKREVVQCEYDFLDGVARHQILAREGRDERHGRWTAWFDSGQRQLEGQYEHDVPTGTWTWWHVNGQIASQGDYANGHQHGVWTWWHENGQRSIVGHYSTGQQSGDWTWWNPAGRVLNRAAYVARKPGPSGAAAPHSGLPSPRRPLRQALRNAPQL